MKKFTNSGQFKKGIVPPTAFKKGHVNLLKGKKMPEEWKAKLRKPKSIVHPFTEERKQKIRKAMTGRFGVLNNRFINGNKTKHSALRRKRLKENGGYHTNGEWELLKKQCNYTCLACLKVEPEIKLTQDHVISIKRGGTDNIENIQPLCHRCNVKKHSKCIKY